MRRNFIFERFFAAVIAMAAILIVFAVSIIFIFGEQYYGLVAEFFAQFSIDYFRSFICKWGLLFGTVLLMSFMYYSIPNVKWSFPCFSRRLIHDNWICIDFCNYSRFIFIKAGRITANGAFGTLIVFMGFGCILIQCNDFRALNVIVYRFRHPKQDTEGVTDEKEELNVWR